MQFKTTFWTDFTIADAFGASAVVDTFKRAFAEWRDDVMYATELAIVLNWKCWQHWQDGDDVLGKLYHDLYFEVDGWCLDHFEGDDARYYFKMTD